MMVTMRERFEEFGFAVNKWVQFALWGGWGGSVSKAWRGKWCWQVKREIQVSIDGFLSYLPCLCPVPLVLVLFLGP